MSSSQLTLSVNLKDDATFSNYFIGNNAQLVTNLHTMANGRGSQYLYFWGKSGVGRTHLLHACCNIANQRKLSSFYLSFANLNNLQPEIFDDLEKMLLICIDDIQCIAGQQLWEEAFFSFFNRIHENKKRLIIASDSIPQNLGLNLHDLTSRLTSGIVLKIHELTDEEKIQTLILRAKRRGMNLPRNAAQFLWRRWSRDMHSLFNVLNTLDEASLAAKHKITIPFVKSVLGL
jgi:DnaA family protein